MKNMNNKLKSKLIVYFVLKLTLPLIPICFIIYEIYKALSPSPFGYLGNIPLIMGICFTIAICYIFTISYEFINLFKNFNRINEDEAPRSIKWGLVLLLNLLVIIIGITLSVKATNSGRIKNFHDISENHLNNSIASVETYFNGSTEQITKTDIKGKFYKTKRSEAAEFKKTALCVGRDSVTISIEYFAGSNKSAASTFNDFWVERFPSFGSNLQELDDIEFIQNFMQNYNSMIKTDLSEKYNVDKASSKYNPSKGYLFRCLDDSYYLTIEISACSCGKTTIKSADELDRICIEQLNKLKQK